MLTPSGVVAMREEHRVLLRALDPLPTDQQITLMLYYWEDMNSSQISDVLEVPVSTVTTRLSRARARLLDEVQAVGAADEVERSLLDDLDRWARSMVPRNRT